MLTLPPLDGVSAHERFPMYRRHFHREVVFSLVVVVSSISNLASAAVFGEQVPPTFQVIRYLSAWALRVRLSHNSWIKVGPHCDYVAHLAAVGTQHPITASLADYKVIVTASCVIHVPTRQAAHPLSREKLLLA